MKMITDGGDDMTDQALQAIEKILGYRFQNPALLKQAFTRSSYTNEMLQAKTPADTDSNEVLEFIGDSVLSAALALILIKRCGSVGERGLVCPLDEGDLSRIKSNLSDKRALSGIVRELGLAKHLRVSRGDLANGILCEASPQGDLFESIIGAIALDSKMDFDILIPILERLDRPDRLTERPHAKKDPKSTVKEYCEKNRLSYVFHLVSESGPDHAKEYRVCLKIDGREAGFGVGRSKKLADRSAAEDAIAQNPDLCQP
jgi:ribonuclease-3